MNTTAAPYIAPRYRLAKPGSRLKGCPLRHHPDQNGVVYMGACADLQGTLSSCHVCQRHGSPAMREEPTK